jgi:hypothetical protein
MSSNPTDPIELINALRAELDALKLSTSVPATPVATPKRGTPAATLSELVGLSDFLPTERSAVELENATLQVISKTERVSLSPLHSSSTVEDEENLRADQKGMFRKRETFNRMIIKQITKGNIIQDFYAPRKDDDGSVEPILIGDTRAPREPKHSFQRTSQRAKKLAVSKRRSIWLS